ncbi:hypothetical protein BDQ12DRAFT_686557 [Crucibulum laeve]|uniref:Uncharacterized protein n=1 Tax=Crucibulum laeve TaxID=68775 RepID=A0A5C3LVY6_9AGAR|nr:hypothetical protein BDQ12DRAFT_686557 [Crucibulum laeve]
MSLSRNLACSISKRPTLWSVKLRLHTTAPSRTTPTRTLTQLRDNSSSHEDPVQKTERLARWKQKTSGKQSDYNGPKPGFHFQVIVNAPIYPALRETLASLRNSLNEFFQNVELRVSVNFAMFNKNHLTIVMKPGNVRSDEIRGHSAAMCDIIHSSLKCNPDRPLRLTFGPALYSVHVHDVPLPRHRSKDHQYIREVLNVLRDEIMSANPELCITPEQLDKWQIYNGARAVFRDRDLPVRIVLFFEDYFYAQRALQLGVKVHGVVCRTSK